jgi:dipeptidyl aminopeptidase/acylaminoacyl peptidase
MNRNAVLSLSLVVATNIFLGDQRSAQLAPDRFVLTRLADDKILRKDLQVLLTPDQWGGQISPDSKKLALTRSFSGTSEVWICDIDGSNLRKLTSLDGPQAGSPRWSPDGKWIAFDVNWENQGKIFIVSVQGGPAREVAPNSASPHLVPNWSRDGKWIYFASDASGKWQVWKAPVSAGEPVQITHQGGFAAAESPDGAFVYYSKHRYRNPEVWRVPTGGNNEEIVSPLVRPMTWADWSATAEGIYFVGLEGTKPVLQYFDFKSPSIVKAAELANPSFYLSLSTDVRLVVCAGKNWMNMGLPD